MTASSPSIVARTSSSAARSGGISAATSSSGDSINVPWNPVPFSSLTPIQKQWIYEQRDEISQDLIRYGELSDSTLFTWRLFGYDPIQPELAPWLAQQGISLDMQLDPNVYPDEIIEAQRTARSQAQVRNVIQWIEENLGLPISGNLETLVDNYRDKYYTNGCLNYHDSNFCFVSAVRVNDVIAVNQALADYSKGKMDSDKITAGIIEAARFGNLELLTRLLEILDTNLVEGEFTAEGEPKPPKYLIDAGLHLPTIDAALAAAAENGQEKIIGLLAGRGSKMGRIAALPGLIHQHLFVLASSMVPAFEESDVITPVLKDELLRSTERNDLEACQFIGELVLKKRLDIDAYPALRLASQLGYTSIVKYILDTASHRLDIGVSLRLAIQHNQLDTFGNAYLPIFSVESRPDIILDGIVAAAERNYYWFISPLFSHLGVQEQETIDNAFQVLVTYNQVVNIPEVLEKTSIAKIISIFKSPLYYETSMQALNVILEFLGIEGLRAVLPSLAKYDADMHQLTTERIALMEDEAAVPLSAGPSSSTPIDVSA